MPEDRPTAGDRVERRDLLGEHRRVPIRHPGDKRPEPDTVGLAGQGGQRQPALQHRLIGLTDAADLVQVVHDRHEVEAGHFRRLGLLDDAVEQPIRRGIWVGERWKVEPEPDAHGPMVGPTADRRITTLPGAFMPRCGRSGPHDAYRVALRMEAPDGRAAPDDSPAPVHPVRVHAGHPPRR